MTGAGVVLGTIYGISTATGITTGTTGVVVGDFTGYAGAG